jgi:hypothetical protein
VPPPARHARSRSRPLAPFFKASALCASLLV